MDAWGIAHDAADDVVGLWEQAVIGLLAHRADTAACVQAIRREDPLFVPAIALEACAMLFKGRRALRPQVGKCLGEAHRALAKRPDARNELLVSALEAWSRDECGDALQQLAALRATHPADPFIAKLQHGLLFLLGQTETMLRVLEDTRAAWMRHAEGQGYLRGCLAFALEENGRREDAEREGREAVEAEPEDAWGIHAVAHVMGMQDRVGECISWLDQHAAGYADCGIFKRHVYWHWALMHLERDEAEAALHLFDTRVRGEWLGDYRDMSNQATLLWRLEREGVDVGERWDALVEIAREHAFDHGSAFADVHYAMALARDPRCADFVESLTAHCEKNEGWQAQVQTRVGAPLAQLVAAAMRGDEVDLDAFEVLSSSIVEIGGSLAQREIFELLRIEAALRAKSPYATTWLEERLQARATNAWALKRLTRGE